MEGAGHKPTIASIIKAVAEAHLMTPDEIMENSRRRAVAWPRQIAMYLAWEVSANSLPKIGREMDGRDHTTILFGHRRVAARMDSEPLFRNFVEAIRAHLLTGSELPVGVRGDLKRVSSPADRERARAMIEAGFYPLTEDGRLRRSFRAEGLVNA